MCLWHWQKGHCLQEVSIPKQTQATLSKASLQVVWEKVGGTFLVVESSIGETFGYRATVWQLTRQ